MTDENRNTIRKHFRVHQIRRKLSKFFRKKLLRLLFWLLAMVCAVWVAGMVFVRPMARSAISELCNGAAVYIGSGRLKGLTGIRLEGVVIAEDTEALVNAPVFRFDEIDITFDPWKLLRGKREVTSIHLSDFLFNATYKTQGQWNFSSLINPDLGLVRPSDKIPLVEIHNGAMRISRLEDQRPKAITTVSLNGQVAVQTGKREYSFSLKTDGRFGFGNSELGGLLKIGRRGEKSRFIAEGTIQMPKTKVFENAWDLNDVRLEFEFDRQELTLKRCEFLMGPGHVNIQGTIWRNEVNQRQLNLAVNMQQFNLSDEYEKNTIVYSQPIRNLLGARLRSFLTRYHPTGTGDIQLLVRGSLEDLSNTRIDGSVVCRDITILDEKFPYQLDHLQGAVEFSGRDLMLHQLRAKHDDVDLQIHGSLLDLGPNVRTDLRITSPNMEFNEDLYRALKPSQKKVWYSFTPKGRTAIDYHFQRFTDGRTNLTLVLELKNANLIYEHFPYPLEHLTGTVTVKPDSIEFQDIASHYEDSRAVTLNGTVFEITSPQPKFQIHVRGEQIPVDEILVNAMPASQRDFFHKLDLEAVADMDVDVFPNQTGKRFLDYIAKIHVDGKHLMHEEFPLPMEDVHLTVDVTNEVVLLRHFDGRTGGGQVEMSGIVTPKGIDPDEPGVCLDIDLQDFDFNDTFWNAAGDDAERILGKLRIRGRMDVSGHLARNLSGNACAQTNLFIQCSDNPVLWDGRPLGKAFGQLHLEGDVIEFEDFQFQEARLEAVPDELLEGRLKAFYSGMQPRGRVQVRIDEGMLRMGQDGPEQMDMKGEIELVDAAVGREQPIHHILGEIDGHLEYNCSREIWQALASCHIDHFNYRQWVVSDFRGDFAYDPNTRHFDGRDVAADLYGGRMDGDIKVDLSSDDTLDYKLGFTFEDIDVPRMFGGNGQNVMERVKQGVASGVLSLQGDLRAPEQSRGDVTVNVVNMQLGRQSTLGKILTAVQFKQPDEYIFSEFTAQADIQGPRLLIEDIRMVGKPLVFRGTGTLDLAAKQIALDWVAYDRLMGSDDTILDMLARGIGSAIWKVEVRGDLNNPQIDAVFLSVLKQPLDIFKKKEP